MVNDAHPVAVDPQVLDETERHDVLVQIGILDDLQCVEHRRFSDHNLIM